MGADGHIKIYNMEKFKYRYKEEEIKSFFDEFGSSIMYRQSPLDGREYLTRYFGDNLWSEDLYDTVVSYYNLEKDEFPSNQYGSYETEYFMKMTKKQRQKFHEMIMFLEDECYITTWEVWT